MLLLEYTRLQKFFQKLQKFYIPKNNEKRPRYFLSFRDHLKLGIKPTESYVDMKKPGGAEKFENVEPYGIYAVPLMNWEDFGNFIESPDIYFHDRKYIFLLETNPSANIIYLSDFPHPKESWKEMVHEALEKYGYTNPSVSLTKYFIDNGIDGVVDNVGNIMSKYGERYQAVFFKPSALEVLDVIKNDDKVTIDILKKLHSFPSDVYQELEYALMDENYKYVIKILRTLLPSEDVGKLMKSFMEFKHEYEELFDEMDKNVLPEYFFYIADWLGYDIYPYDFPTIKEDLKNQYELHHPYWDEEDYEEFENFLEEYDLKIN